VAVHAPSVGAMRTTNAEPAPLTAPVVAHWIPDRPHAAHILDATHIGFPPGERAFCRVLGQAARGIDDPVLKAQITTFIRQEARHATAHAQAYEHLEVRGTWSTRAVALTDLTVAAMLGRGRTRSRSVLLWRVASVAAMEHLTAEMGRWVFEDARFEDRGCDPRVVELLRWHAAEEVEHRSVAFDTLQALRPGGARVVRSLAMGFSIPVIFLAWFACAQALLLDDRTTKRKLLLPNDLRRAADEGLLPSFPALFRSMLSFCTRDYHPSTRVPVETVARAEAFLAGSRVRNATAG
jgi:predicted metal-dependent hydrolase